MEKELREHRSSFVVFYTLRLLVIVIFIRQIIIGGYESAFYCALAYLLLYVPSWIQVYPPYFFSLSVSLETVSFFN